MVFVYTVDMCFGSSQHSGRYIDHYANSRKEKGSFFFREKISQ